MLSRVFAPMPMWWQSIVPRTVRRRSSSPAASPRAPAPSPLTSWHSVDLTGAGPTRTRATTPRVTCPATMRRCRSCSRDSFLAFFIFPTQVFIILPILLLFNNHNTTLLGILLYQLLYIENILVKWFDCKCFYRGIEALPRRAQAKSLHELC